MDNSPSLCLTLMVLHVFAQVRACVWDERDGPKKRASHNYVTLLRIIVSVFNTKISRLDKK